MTALSRAAWALLLGLAGCTTRFKLDPARTPDLVDPYSERQECIIYYRGTGYVIRPEQEPELRVVARRPSCQPARGELAPAAAVPATPAPAPATESFAAPLGDVRAKGDVLYFPDRRAVRTSELERAELVLSDAPPASLKRSPKDGQPDQSPEAEPPSSRMNFFGGQVGGSGVVQIVYRRRIYGPLFFDVGGLVVPAPVLHGSAGLVLEVPISSRWSIYTGGGGGIIAVLGGSEVCTSDSGSGDAEGSDEAGHCVTSTDTTAYLYGRVGVALRLGSQLRDQIGLDGGFWRGNERNAAANGSNAAMPFLWPMAGLSVLHAL